ncbi:Glycoside hydrolase 2 Mannanase beta-galactosidase [Mitosporidium daphniae]|uniref:Bms1-type G domain-containing protein n=1 Tax=Mitosporidium daphniae TaxID=1485682 RepID=A0A098VY77_9MICR|nr:uncharacterized protein DI09_13p200 [Mitosporidium daphniae]KGG52731.1 hypothetical protein DI09_13p200 [Mitosporidium daphniae]|eukprot:XP_013239158.1 uncharacterized protein DI09_13p200 [Mitosporidium daphniae]
MTAEFHKQHRPSQAGRKKDKKAGPGKAAVRQNPKAFAVYRGSKAAKSGQRTADKKEAKFHVPLVNRTPDLDPPPLVVAIVGPPNVGKSTLIRSLVKRFSRQNLSKVSGPITVVSGKSRRITLLECPNDLGAMIDVAKIADLVVLLIDASYGFEMETFEFLAIASSHGMPKVIGAMTHLDTFTSPEALKKSKHALKHRWWSETHSGVKLFSLSGVVGGNSQTPGDSRTPLYYPRDVLNLSRLLAVAKPRPIIWKNTNSYLLIDRIEDLTPPDILREAPHSDRKVALYGWTRGCTLRPPLNISTPISAHVPGIGDLSLNSITRLEDPCPTPERLKASLKAPVEADQKQSKRPRATLKDLERRLYAPMADVAGILYDKDAVYLDIPDSRANINEDGELTILDELKGTSFQSLDDRLRKSDVQMFSKKSPTFMVENEESDYDTYGGEEDILNESDDAYSTDINAVDEYGSADEANDMLDASCSEEDSDIEQFYNNDESGDPIDLFTKFEAQDDHLCLKDEDNPAFLDSKWKEALASRRKAMPPARSSIQAQVYGDYISSKSEFNSARANRAIKSGSKRLFSDSEESDLENVATDVESEANDGFFTLNKSANSPSNDQEINPNDITDASDLQALDVLKRTRFVSGAMNGSQGFSESEDFEDLEKGLAGGLSDGDDEDAKDELSKKKTDIKKRFDIEYDTGKRTLTSKEMKIAEDDDMFAAAKRSMAAQEALNRAAFEDESVDVSDQIRGFLPGTYVRIILEKAPAELIEYFDPSFPIIVGVVPFGSENAKFGTIHARVKKHRWHETILKSDEPLIWSAGWRRFQSIPLFYTHDRGARVDSGASRRRMIKYTPRHSHCMAAFYGPLLPNNTGIVACRSVKSTCSGWRLALTGISLESSSSADGDDQQKSGLVKKLKLTGTPLKIAKHTALIKDMFNSALEVAKFEGAALRTVSGIRGSIKKAVHEGPAGTFRATFEDKLLMSDIVFLRAWTQISPRSYYNPITSLLLRNKSDWVGMRLNWEIRRALDAPKPASQKPSSVYDTRSTEEDRTQHRRFNPLHIPKKLEESLPFASKPKMQTASAKTNKKQPINQALAVIRDEKEKKVASLIQELGTLKHARDEKRKLEEQKKRKLLQEKQNKKMSKEETKKPSWISKKNKSSR